MNLFPSSHKFNLIFIFHKFEREKKINEQKNIKPPKNTKRILFITIFLSPFHTNRSSISCSFLLHRNL